MVLDLYEAKCACLDKFWCCTRVHSGTHMAEKMNTAQDTLHLQVVIRRAGDAPWPCVASTTTITGVQDKLPTLHLTVNISSSLAALSGYSTHF